MTTLRLQPLASLIKLAAAVAISCAGAAAAERAVRLDRPNIVFIMADDLGYGHLGCYGQQHIQTPNIDRLSAEGMRFTQVYAGCALCAPCRSVLMTGYHMGHTSVRINSGGAPLLDSDVTIAEVLKAAGYTTGCFGKWGLGDAETDGMASRQGFDEFFGYYHQIHAHRYYPEYLWHNDDKVALAGNADGQRIQYSHDEIMRRSLDFIRRYKDDPFFCYLPLTIPHLELAVPEDSLKPYLGKFPEKPWKGLGHYPAQTQPFATYAGMISRMDRDVGKLMSLLEELGLDGRTIVFFTSDNGAQGGIGPLVEFFHGSGPFRDYKGALYEGGIRVPMIARWPGRISAGSVSDYAWYFPDVLPTLAELAGVSDSVPDGIDGLSVVPTLLGKKAAGRKQVPHRFLYWELGQGKQLKQALRIGDWKLVRPNQGAKLELYDLKTDEGETTDVADRHPDVIADAQSIFSSVRTDRRPQREPKMPPGKLYR